MDRVKLGQLGEDFAVNYLVQNGFIIISRNQQFNSHHKKIGELDIVAFKDNITYIFEVKTRRTFKFGGAVQSITKQKLQTLYTITEFLSHQYESIKIQLIAIDYYKNKFNLTIFDLF